MKRSCSTAASLSARTTHGAVRQLPRVHDLVVERAREHAVAKRTRRVVRQPRRERERVRTARTELDLEHDADDDTQRADTLTE